MFMHLFKYMFSFLVCVYLVGKWASHMICCVELLEELPNCLQEQLTIVHSHQHVPLLIHLHLSQFLFRLHFLGIYPDHLFNPGACSHPCPCLMNILLLTLLACLPNRFCFLGMCLLFHCTYYFSHIETLILP